MPLERGYQSPTPYVDARIHAAAVYCSDGRVGDQIDEFLHLGLGLPRYDRVACPGGPVALSGRLQALWDARGVEDQLRFLAEVHELRQVVLIAHQGCAYYGVRLALPAERVEDEQRADLARARDTIGRVAPQLEVIAFYARVVEGRVRFDPHRLEPARGRA